MSDILTAIAGKLGDLVNPETWPAEIEEWGDEIVTNRNYIDGKHRLDLDDTLAARARLGQDDDEVFSINYSELVVTAMSNRLNVERIDAVVEQSGTGDAFVAAKKIANDWVSEYLIDSDFDEIQNDVNFDAVGDGDTFVMIDPPKDGQSGKFVHEPAWDNEVGIIPVYGEQGRQMTAAVKVWMTTSGDERVNIYYDNRVEKFINSEGALSDFGNDEPKWEDSDGQPLGVPFGHFRNGKLTRNWHGKSRSSKIRPAQDVLNRTFLSMVVTGENTAFQRMITLGFSPGDSIAPGSVWSVVDEDEKGNEVAGLDPSKFYDFKLIEPGQITPFVEQANLTIEQISITGNTPISTVSGGGSNESGEALKQRESGLLAESKTNQIIFGNVWKRLMLMAWKAERTFNDTAPDNIKRFNTVWLSAEIRNNKEVIENIILMKDDLPRTKRLEEAAPVFESYDTDEISKMIVAKEAENVALISQLIANGNNGRADRDAAAVASVADNAIST